MDKTVSCLNEKDLFAEKVEPNSAAGKDEEMDIHESKRKSVPLEEQETVILFLRNEPFASIYTSDSTMITKMDKLCAANPEMYSVIEQNWSGKRYRLNDKTLLGLRLKKREISEAQRAAAAERFRSYWESRQGSDA